MAEPLLIAKEKKPRRGAMSASSHLETRVHLKESVSGAAHPISEMTGAFRKEQHDLPDVKCATTSPRDLCLTVNNVQGDEFTGGWSD